jgi:fructosamine-3-kinase
VFLKHYPLASRGLAEAEADGLAWLSAAKAIRVASVLAVGSDWIALDWIEAAPPAANYADQLGRGLAALHAAVAPCFGFEADNWIGRLEQTNDRRETWEAFYLECRIEPLRRRAVDGGLLAGGAARRLDALVDALPDLIGPSEPPARLHGDLWNGNVICDESGAPCLIDPAVYGGHREIDLAMMRLFGGFGADVFEAYTRHSPLTPGAEQRVALYQVYPLLVHVCLFGGSYVGGLMDAVDSALETVGYGGSASRT